MDCTWTVVGAGGPQKKKKKKPALSLYSGRILFFLLVVTQHVY